MITTTATQQPSVKQSGRIEYIDALRGFTMLLVVFNHVAMYCFSVKGVPSFHDYLTQVRMPMFFFISGFVLFKRGVVWDAQHVISFFSKKLPIQLVSPLVFFLAFVHIKGFNLVQSIENCDKMGYWFTLVLLEYYAIYAIVMFCCKKWWSKIILVAIGLLLFFIKMPAIFAAIPLSESLKGILSIQHWHFFFFFVLGTLAREHFDVVERILDNGWLITVCLVFYFLGNAYIDYLPTDNGIPGLLLTFLGLIILFTFFRTNQQAFSKQKALGRTLQYVGRRTLDVYLIHYFLLPIQLGFITVFADHPMPIIEGTASLIISIIIVAVSLLIGNIIRLSPILAHWCFGVKYPNKQ